MIVHINQEFCNSCGICGRVCPRHIPETIDLDGKKTSRISPERANLCMACGHCAAVCPNQAIYVDGIPAEAYLPLTDMTISEDQLLTLLRQRRSIRRYKNKPVPRAVLDRIVEAARLAPTGTGRDTTGVIIIDNPKILSEFSELVYKTYEFLETALKNPISRQFVRRKASKEAVRTLQEFVMPGMEWYIRWYRAGESNEILRDCRALMLFDNPIHEPMAPQNCLIAAFHAILMAETLGVGTCFNDLIPPVCGRSQEIRELLGLPPDREVYASVTMGYPKYKFERVPPRGLSEVRYLD